MINGAHAIIYSKDVGLDRAFFKDVLGLHHVDAGSGWLIFELPPAEVAFHRVEAGKPSHEIYLMCDDIDAGVNELKGKGVTSSPSSTTSVGVALRSSGYLAAEGSESTSPDTHARQVPARDRHPLKPIVAAKWPSDRRPDRHRVTAVSRIRETSRRTAPGPCVTWVRKSNVRDDSIAWTQSANLECTRCCRSPRTSRTRSSTNPTTPSSPSSSE